MLGAKNVPFHKCINKDVKQGQTRFSESTESERYPKESQAALPPPPPPTNTSLSLPPSLVNTAPLLPSPFPPSPPSGPGPDVSLPREIPQQKASSEDPQWTIVVGFVMKPLGAGQNKRGSGHRSGTGNCDYAKPNRSIRGGYRRIQNHLDARPHNIQAPNKQRYVTIILSHRGKPVREKCRQFSRREAQKCVECLKTMLNSQNFLP